MEPEGSRPDLFDIKFLRDELLYYSRDENQFHRRRRAFVFALAPDLVATRFKDPELPLQRGVLLLALIVTAIRRLTELLSSDALRFEILFVAEGKAEPLAPERALLETLLRDSIANGTTHLLRMSSAAVPAWCTEMTRRSLCHCLAIGTAPLALQVPDVPVTQLRVDGARPTVALANAEPTVQEADDALGSWIATLALVLQNWI
jgi:hypothetical protein